jgi:hypothetical protein
LVSSYGGQARHGKMAGTAYVLNGRFQGWVGDVLVTNGYEEVWVYTGARVHAPIPQRVIREVGSILIFEIVVAGRALLGRRK